ncbi:GNAT family N-acetyltransferase [Peribacillus sp. NPDC096540]|uniref:GNAT family N-acetyltransferase n=1 Tax=Peribacillus sp. NPDC096540 TaxID=3390612 RepID=UPI003D05DE6A
MKQLTENEFEKVSPIIYMNEGPTPTFAHSVLEHFIPGCVFVDDSSFPKTILLGTNSGIYFICGVESNDEFNMSLLEFCKTKMGDGEKRFTLFSSNDKWDRLLAATLKEEIKQISRYSFTFHPEKYFYEEFNPQKEFTLQRIDEDTIRNSVYNKEYYEDYWGSVSNFLEKAFGFSVLHNETVASECTTIFRGKAFAEIDIETNTEYRGMGLARSVAHAFIDHCLKNKIVPCWDCTVSNLPSMKLAEKLGFGNPRKYSIFVKNS